MKIIDSYQKVNRYSLFMPTICPMDNKIGAIYVFNSGYEYKNSTSRNVPNSSRHTRSSHMNVYISHNQSLGHLCNNLILMVIKIK